MKRRHLILLQYITVYISTSIDHAPSTVDGLKLLSQHSRVVISDDRRIKNLISDRFAV